MKTVADLKRTDIHRHKELFKIESDRNSESYTKIELAFDGNPYDDLKKSTARPSRIYWLSNETLGMNDIADERQSGHPKVKGLLNRHIGSHLNSREDLKLVGFSVSMHDKNRLQITSQKSKLFGVRTIDVLIENNRIKGVESQVMELSNYFRLGKIFLLKLKKNNVLPDIPEVLIKSRNLTYKVLLKILRGTRTIRILYFLSSKSLLVGLKNNL